MGGPRALDARVAILIGFALATAAMPLAAAYSAYWTKAPVDDPLWLTGYLVWSGGQGRVAWDPAAESEDHRPALPDDATQQKRQEDYRLDAAMDSGRFNRAFTSGYHFTEPIADDVFQFDPLPRTVLLDANVGIQLTLYLQNNPNNPGRPCQEFTSEVQGAQDAFSQRAMEPVLEVELRADGALLGWASGEDTVNWGNVLPEKAEPEPPMGYGACYFRLHPEAHMLEEGTVLQLKVRHAKQAFYYSYGFRGTHQSLVQFALLSQEELLYRFPELAPEEPVDQPPAGTPALPVAAAPALLALGRKRGRLALAVVALLGVGLAGCLGGPDRAGPANVDVLPSGSVDVTIVPDTEGELTAPGKGLILGRVRDDLNLPIVDVHVALLGTPAFAKSDPKGRFHFTNLTEGTYRLRFDHVEYRNYEATVPVKAGSVSRPDFTLFLVNPKLRDARPHPHDYWDGKSTLDGGTFQARCPDWASSLFGPQPLSTRPEDDHCYKAQGTLRPFPDGGANLVPPGTTFVEVRLDWVPDELRADRLGLAVGSMGPSTIVLAPRGPDETFRIATTWEMTDEGHASRTAWWFEWFVPLSNERDWQDRRDRAAPSYEEPPVTFSVKFLKGGSIPLGRAHPDRWNGADQVVVVPGLALWTNANLIPPGTAVPEDPCVAVTGYGCMLGSDAQVFWPDSNRVVPDGTGWLDVTLTRERIPAPYYEWKLQYKPANVTDADWQTGAGFWNAVASSDGTQSSRSWRIPIGKDSLADSPYVKDSAWLFRIVPEDRFAAWQDYWASQPSRFLEQTFETVTLRVVAKRGTGT